MFSAGYFIKYCLMKRSLVFIFIIIIGVSACSSPIGSIRYGVNRNYDDFWVVPRRHVYYLGDYYNRNNDLWVFASNGGIVETIPVSDVTIEIIRNPDNPNPDAPIEIINGNFRFEALPLGVGTGRKLIRVSYSGKIAEYSIDVTDPYGIGGNGDDDGPGINIVWQ